jgi:RNase P/RNase MRP subunit p29
MFHKNLLKLTKKIHRDIKISQANLVLVLRIKICQIIQLFRIQGSLLNIQPGKSANQQSLIRI